MCTTSWFIIILLTSYQSRELKGNYFLAKIELTNSVISSTKIRGVIQRKSSVQSEQLGDLLSEMMQSQVIDYLRYALQSGDLWGSSSDCLSAPSTQGDSSNDYDATARDRAELLEQQNKSNDQVKQSNRQHWSFNYDSACKILWTTVRDAKN